MRISLLTLCFLGFSLGLLAQKELIVNGMHFSYELMDGAIEIELKAPTQGWLGVGFNSENDIVKSDLLLFRVVNQKPEVLDMYVLGLGNPQEDQNLGGTKDVVLLDGAETRNQSRVRFRLPMPATDPYDFRLEKGKSFWLILAYSTHDDFGHHSRMRKHVAFQLE